MEEQELATRCARRDREAREELFKRYSSRLYALCVRYTRNRQEADDLLQDAFIRVFDRMGRFRWQGEGSLYRWMSRLTLNLFFDKARRRRLMRETDYQETLQVPPEKLKTFIDGLPERYRTVFQLYCIDNLSHAEIAGLLGIKEKTSSAELARARVLLSKQIKAYLHENE